MTTKASRPTAKRASTKKAKKPSAAARRQLTSILSAACGDDGDPQGDLMLDNLLDLQRDVGDAFVPLAEEVGALERVVGIGALGMTKALLDAGVDPNARPADLQRNAMRPRALGAPFPVWRSNGRHQECELPDETLRPILESLLARGASTEEVCPNEKVQGTGPRYTALDGAVRCRSRVGIELLAPASSETTRNTALVTAVLECGPQPMCDDRAPEEATLELMLAHGTLEGPTRDGFGALHAAAFACAASVFERLFARAQTKSPQLAAPVSVGLANATGPSGGVSPTLRFAASATPFAVATAVRDRLAQTAAEYDAHGDGGPFQAKVRASLAERIAAAERILALLAQHGLDQAGPSEALPPHLAAVRSACSELATALGVANFDARVRLVDWSGMGPWGYLQACASLIRPSLDDRARARLGSTLFADCLTGAVERHVELGPDYESDPEDGDLYLVWPDNYLDEHRAVIEAGNFVGMRGNALVCLERVAEGVTKIWEVSRDGGVDHGDVVGWVRASVQSVLASAP